MWFTIILCTREFHFPWKTILVCSNVHNTHYCMGQYKMMSFLCKSPHKPRNYWNINSFVCSCETRNETPPFSPGTTIHSQLPPFRYQSNSPHERHLNYKLGTLTRCRYPKDSRERSSQAYKVLVTQYPPSPLQEGEICN